MTGTYEIDAAAGVIILRVAGDPDPAVSRKLLEAARRDPRFRPGMGVLVDRRGLTDLPSEADTAELVDYLSSEWRRTEIGRWAVLTTPGAAFGMARMLDLRASLRETEVGSFTQEAEARAWLAARSPAPGGGDAGRTEHHPGTPPP